MQPRSGGSSRPKALPSQQTYQQLQSHQLHRQPSGQQLQHLMRSTSSSSSKQKHKYQQQQTHSKDSQRKKLQTETINTTLTGPSYKKERFSINAKKGINVGRRTGQNIKQSESGLNYDGSEKVEDYFLSKQQRRRLSMESDTEDSPQQQQLQKQRYSQQNHLEIEANPLLSLSSLSNVDDDIDGHLSGGGQQANFQLNQLQNETKKRESLSDFNMSPEQELLEKEQEQYLPIPNDETGFHSDKSIENSRKTSSFRARRSALATARSQQYLLQKQQQQQLQQQQQSHQLIGIGIRSRGSIGLSSISKQQHYKYEYQNESDHSKRIKPNGRGGNEHQQDSLIDSDISSDRLDDFELLGQISNLPPEMIAKDLLQLRSSSMSLTGGGNGVGSTFPYSSGPAYRVEDDFEISLSESEASDLEVSAAVAIPAARTLAANRRSNKINFDNDGAFVTQRRQKQQFNNRVSGQDQNSVLSRGMSDIQDDVEISNLLQANRQIISEISSRRRTTSSNNRLPRNSNINSVNNQNKLNISQSSFASCLLDVSESRIHRSMYPSQSEREKDMVDEISSKHFNEQISIIQEVNTQQTPGKQQLQQQQQQQMQIKLSEQKGLPNKIEITIEYSDYSFEGPREDEKQVVSIINELDKRDREDNKFDGKESEKQDEDVEKQKVEEFVYRKVKRNTKRAESQKKQPTETMSLDNSFVELREVVGVASESELEKARFVDPQDQVGNEREMEKNVREIENENVGERDEDASRNNLENDMVLKSILSGLEIDQGSQVSIKAPREEIVDVEMKNVGSKNIHGYAGSETISKVSEMKLFPEILVENVDDKQSKRVKSTESRKQNTKKNQELNPEAINKHDAESEEAQNVSLVVKKNNVPTQRRSIENGDDGVEQDLKKTDGETEKQKRQINLKKGTQKQKNNLKEISNEEQIDRKSRVDSSFSSNRSNSFDSLNVMEVVISQSNQMEVEYEQSQTEQQPRKGIRRKRISPFTERRKKPEPRQKPNSNRRILDSSDSSQEQSQNSISSSQESFSNSDSSQQDKSTERTNSRGSRSKTGGSQYMSSMKWETLQQQQQLYSRNFHNYQEEIRIEAQGEHFGENDRYPVRKRIRPLISWCERAVYGSQGLLYIIADKDSNDFTKVNYKIPGFSNIPDPRRVLANRVKQRKLIKSTNTTNIVSANSANLPTIQENLNETEINFKVEEERMKRGTDNSRRESGGRNSLVSNRVGEQRTQIRTSREKNSTRTTTQTNQKLPSQDSSNSENERTIRNSIEEPKRRSLRLSSQKSDRRESPDQKGLKQLQSQLNKKDLEQNSSNRRTSQEHRENIQKRKQNNTGTANKKSRLSLQKGEEKEIEKVVGPKSKLLKKKENLQDERMKIIRSIFGEQNDFDSLHVELPTGVSGVDGKNKIEDSEFTFSFSVGAGKSVIDISSKHRLEILVKECAWKKLLFRIQDESTIYLKQNDKKILKKGQVFSLIYKERDISKHAILQIKVIKQTVKNRDALNSTQSSTDSYS